MNNLLRQKAEEEERNQKLKDKVWNEDLAAIPQKAIWGYDRPQIKWINSGTQCLKKTQQKSTCNSFWNILPWTFSTEMQEVLFFSVWSEVALENCIPILGTRISSWSPSTRAPRHKQTGRGEVKEAVKTEGIKQKAGNTIAFDHTNSVTKDRNSYLQSHYQLDICFLKRFISGGKKCFSIPGIQPD